MKTYRTRLLPILSLSLILWPLSAFTQTIIEGARYAVF